MGAKDFQGLSMTAVSKKQMLTVCVMRVEVFSKQYQEHLIWGRQKKKKGTNQYVCINESDPMTELNCANCKPR